MTYYQFVQAVESKMKEVISEDVTLGIYSAEKNNGVKRQGITIAQKGINISPTIYLEEYYEKYVNGYHVEEIVNDILELYYEVRLQKSWDEEKIRSYESMKEKIVYRLVNYEANSSLLTEIPHIPYLDLAIIFYVMLEINDHGTACMLIRNEHLTMWEVTKVDIYKKAKDNTWKLLPSEFHTMRAMMEGYNKNGTYTGMDILHVLTNGIRSFGAATILYDGVLEMIGDFLGDNYYVLPSSVHEVIIVSEAEAPWGGSGLSDMVREINHTQVDDEDILSDTAYYYDREKKKLL